MRALAGAGIITLLISVGCGPSAPAPVTAGTSPEASGSPPSSSAHHVAPAAAAPTAEAAAVTAPSSLPDPAPAGAAASDANPVREMPRARDVTIPAGTTLTMTLSTGVSSKTSAVEEPVSATLRRAIAVDGVTAIPAGAAVSGHVTEAERSGRVKGRARIGLRFTSLRVADTRYDMRTAPIAREARGTRKKDAVKIGVGAGAGALIGAIAGGKKGAAIGSAAGAGGATGVVLATRGEEVALGRGAVVSTRLMAPLTIRVRVP